MISDDQLLASLDHKLQLLKDRVRGVAEGFSTGLFIWGPGGGGKTYTVEESLRQTGRSFKLTNSRLTGRGLVELIKDFPDIIHILDDAEPLLLDKHAQGVLRSCLWSQDGRQQRVVTWQVCRVREEFLFSGGVIIIANSPLANVPALQALQTRIPVVHYSLTGEEVAAQMRRLARKGHRHGAYELSPAECLEVVEEVVARSQRLERNLDLRLFVLACKDRLQWQHGAAESDWRDLLQSRLQQRVLQPDERHVTPAERKCREMALVERIAPLPPKERLAVWKKESGKSAAALYRCLLKLPSRFLDKPSSSESEKTRK